MEEKSVTAEQMGRAAGITAGTVTQILRGEIFRPPDRRLEGFARVLGVSLQRLLNAIPETIRNTEDKMGDFNWEELDRLKAENVQLVADAKIAEGQRATAAFTAGKTAALTPYEQRVKDGKLMPATFEKLKVAFDQQKDLFAATKEFMVPTAINFEMGEHMPKGEGAADGKTPETSDQPDLEMAAIVEKIAFDKDLPFDKAMVIAFRQNPELAQAYKRTPFHTVDDRRP